LGTNEYAMIDSTIVHAHQHSAGAKGGGSQTPKQLVEAAVRSRLCFPTMEAQQDKGGLSTKIHATTDAIGNPLSFHLTPGQACDLEGADLLLPKLAADIILADKGYDADKRVIELLQSQYKKDKRCTYNNHYV
jgi:IS5 family transposase